MKAITRTLHSFNFSKAREWTKLLSITGSVQIAIQLIGLVSGIIVIRFLSTQEYALYTLVNTMLGTMTILADGGIGSSVMSQGGKVWKDPLQLGKVVATGLDLRKKFAIGSLLVSVPALYYLLLHQNTSFFTASLIVLALVPAFFSALSDSLLEVAPRLKQDIFVLQKNQVSVSIFRCLLQVISLFFFPFAYIAVLAFGLPRIWGNFRLRKISSGYADFTQQPDPEVRKNILAIVKRTLPMGIYYCVSGQITIWLISVFGNTSAIAQIGALGRLSNVLTFVTVMFGTLIVPRFARLPNDSKVLFRRYVMIVGGLVALFSIILSFIYLFPNQILWILGSKYSNLQYALLLNMAGSCINLLAAYCYTLYLCRGWVISPVIAIILNIISIAVAATIFDVTTLEGNLWLTIATAGFQVIMNVVYIQFRIFRLKKSQ